MDLKEAIDLVNGLVEEIDEAIGKDINDNRLKADGLIVQLFNDAIPDTVSLAVINKARLRVEIGNPPGKKGSIGDAINWEWLLTNEMEFVDGEFVIISGDVDFESELQAGKPKEFLQREWKSLNPNCELILYKSLPKFLKDYFPGIQISGEVDKDLDIEMLEFSRSFATTHRAIEALNSYVDFSDQDIIRMLKAYSENRQIGRILEDNDVLEFAKKIVSYVKSEEAKRLAVPLVQKIFNNDIFGLLEATDMPLR